LIAGGSLAGIPYAVLFGVGYVAAGDDATTQGLVPVLHEGTIGIVAAGLLFFALAVILARVGQRRLE
jgi:hypothetical protein